jgi:hypothetical protein
MGLARCQRRTLLLASSLHRSLVSPGSAIARDTHARIMYYDSHLHVWAKKEDAESGLFPFTVRICQLTSRAFPFPSIQFLLISGRYMYADTLERCRERSQVALGRNHRCQVRGFQGGIERRESRLACPIDDQPLTPLTQPRVT